MFWFFPFCFPNLSIHRDPLRQRRAAVTTAHEGSGCFLNEFLQRQLKHRDTKWTPFFWPASFEKKKHLKMTESLYTDAHGELQQKNTQIKGRFFWGRNCSGVLTSSFLSRPLDLVHNSFPRPQQDDDHLRAERIRGCGCLPSAASPRERSAGVRRDPCGHKAPRHGNKLLGRAPEFSREVARTIALILHINRQKYEQQTERLTTCFLYRRKEQM